MSRCELNIDPSKRAPLSQESLPQKKLTFRFSKNPAH